MRLLVFFDLPTETNNDLKSYRNFVKYLKVNGFIRIQFSIYCKLCVNSSSAMTAKNKLEKNVPHKGDIRYIVLSEKQYLSIKLINNKYDINEQITNKSRLLIIGGNYETEDKK